MPCIVDARGIGDGSICPTKARAMGIRVEAGKAIAKVKGGKRVTGVSICVQAGEGAVLEEISCDAVAMSGGWSPVVHLWSHCGGKLVWDKTHAHFRPDAARPPTGHDGLAMVVPVGNANGADDGGGGSGRCGQWWCGCGQAAGFTAEAKAAVAEAAPEADMEAVWIMPQGAGPCAEGQDVAGLSERCESLGRAACCARGLYFGRTYQALHHFGHGDRSG